jgi:FlaA1/EpsC-like NDP-sugar epimerase
MMEKIFSLSPAKKKAIKVVWDGFSLLFAAFVSFVIRYGISDLRFGASELAHVGVSVLLTLIFLTGIGHYRQVIRYMSITAFNHVFMGVAFFAISLFVLSFPFASFIPNSVPFISAFLAAIFIGGPRALIFTTSQLQNYQLREKCVIFGATNSGRSLASVLKQSGDLMPVAFIDDKKQYHGSQVHGIPVLGRDSIPQLVEKHDIKKVLLAVNNSNMARRKELIAELEPFALELLSVPNLSDIVSGKHKIDELREIKIDELLGRDPVPPLQDLLSVNITDKVVMVTGAGGSIGSELCRQISLLKPSKLVLFELSEFNLYQIENELQKIHLNLEIVAILASIQDGEVVRRAMTEHKVQTVYHAAAYKHVPMVEQNIPAGIRNNIYGTANVALIAAECGLEKFVLVSTDKAVRPTNVMGATKRFAELFIQGIAELNEETDYAIVRFGNVLGSSGSVVPLFTRQIKAGGPITVTHPDITRFFMTIPEAALLVIQAGAMGKDGEVYVLDMGESVKIVDLAKKMAHIMGFSIRSEDNPDGTLEMTFSGLRPGEKLYEELLIDDADTKTEHPKIMGADETKVPFSDVLMLMDQLNEALFSKDESQAKQLLIDAPLAYTPAKHGQKVATDRPQALAS